MDNWFTVEKIDSQTFAISEYKHWEEAHCYLLCGNERSVLIDSGLGISNIKRVVSSLTSLPIIVVTTHVHWDHIGNHKLFDTIAVHEMERDWLVDNFPISLQEVKNNIMRLPFDFPDDFNIDKYQIFQGEPQILLHDDDIVDLGGRKLHVIHTPGHSPGHCCFYEPERKYLYSGDLIYKGCLYAFYPTTDPLCFYESIKKVQKYEIEKIFPGHHQLNISMSLLDKIAAEFDKIERMGRLRHGSGLFEFEDFQICI